MGRMLNKEEVLNLLNDDEVARVARAEEIELAAGEEYVDLEHLDKGVQKASTTSRSSIHTLIPRSALSEKTWREIQGAIAS